MGFSAILWGFDGVVLTPQLYRLDPLYVVFVLHLVPFLIMNLFLWREYRFLRLMTPQDLVFFLPGRDGFPRNKFERRTPSRSSTLF